MLKRTSHNQEETIAMGKKLASLVKPGDILCFFGDLGSGKTTFIKGMGKGLGIKEDLVNSPTFVLMNAYQGKLPLYHFDFYRIEQEEEIARIGYEEFFFGKGVSVIEWPERLGHLMPSEYLRIEIYHKSKNSRDLKFIAHGKRYNSLVA